MKWSRLALYVAVATAIAWTLKALAIWEAGGLGRTDAEDVGWAGGFLLYLIAWAALGYALAAGRAVGLRVVAAVVGFFVGFVVVIVLDSAADGLPDSTGWVKEEAGLWAAAILTMAMAWLLFRRSRRTQLRA